MMIANDRFRRGYLVVAVSAIGLLAVGLSYRKATAQNAGGGKRAEKTKTLNVVRSTTGGQVRLGPGIPKGLSLPVLPPEIVDYRDDGVSEALAAGGAIAIGPRGRIAPVGAVAAAVPGQSCRSDAECNDCNPCTLDTCFDSVCVGGDRNGFGCENDRFCEGTCVGGDVGCVGLVCVGGANEGSACTVDADCELCRDDLNCCGNGLPPKICVGGMDDGTGCDVDTDCDSLNCQPNPAHIPDGFCAFNPCTPLTTGGAEGLGGDQCVNALIPVGRFEPGSECDDELNCNGKETCDAGACVPASPLCTDPDTVCDEEQNAACLAFCLPDPPPNPDGQDTICNTDNLACTVDVCDAKLCVLGTRNGLSCQVDADCPGAPPGTCTGGGTGLCIVLADQPCGPSGGCSEGPSCIDGDDDGQPCETNDDCALPGTCPDTDLVTCGKGRCCVAGACSEETIAACAGTWLATDDACQDLILDPAITVLNECPIYGSGIAPQGSFGVEVGPTSSFALCDAIVRVGDDYGPPAAAAGPTGFIEIKLVRFAASGEVSSRTRVELWDKSDPLNPIFIEDVITNGVVFGDAAIITLVFREALVVPASGVFALSNAVEFTPFGAISFLATDGEDLGSNDPLEMFVNGQVITGGFLGECSGGTRDGLWCGSVAPGAACPGGTCDTSVPDILAFEIVGDPADAPLGACCNSETGTCTLQLPWVCRDQGGAFQGIGTLCKFCDNDFFRTCNNDADCPACDDFGGPNQGIACDPAGGDVCANGGGTCTLNATCVDLPPACKLSACCVTSAAAMISVCEGGTPPPGGTAGSPCLIDNDCGPEVETTCTGVATLGDCVPVLGGLCSDNMAPCDNDDECTPPATCEAGCPPGTESQGFGTFCEPNCCDQDPVNITRSGYDNCLLAGANATVINVPALASDPPVVVTLTGNNSTATFDDYNNAVCVDGTGDGQPCNPVAIPDPCDDGTIGTGGSCTRLCGQGRFNPDGTTLDPGWWEAISIDKCADVRLDLCCTDINGLVLQPQWSQLVAGCPCSVQINNDGVEPPIGSGEGGQGFARGSPFCSGDNLWLTFRGLGAGTYYLPILSDQDGTCAAPAAGGAGCEYQFHITVGACRLAACCANLCNGGDRDGRPCDPAGVDDCPGPTAECVSGFCVGGAFDGLPCDVVTGVVDQCPGESTPGMPAECGNKGCAETNELECTTGGGFWLAGVDFPDAICFGGGEEAAGAECTPGAACNGGTCVAQEEIASCLGGPCSSKGSCCFGPGDCRDNANEGQPCDPNQAGTCMTPSLCNQLGGAYIGGARCLFEPPACPVCTVEDPGNCQRGNAGFITSMDRTNDDGLGRKIADDFIAQSTEIEQFCFGPSFVNVEGGFVVNECSDPDNPAHAPQPPDNYEIRFFNDVNGLPGELVSPAHELAPAVIAAKSKTDTRVWNYSIVFDPPLGGFVIGDRYWIEFSGAGNPGGAGVGCDIFLFLSEDGNGFYLQEFDAFSEEQVWTFEDNSNDNLDASFCIGGPGFPSIEIPPPLTGCCCQCDGTRTDNVPWGDCRGLICLKDGTGGSGVDCQPLCTPDDQAAVPGGCEIAPLFADAKFFPDQACAQIVCENVGAGGCPGVGGPVGENCTDPLVIDEGEFPFDNTCSSTDGRVSFDPSPGCDSSPDPGETFTITFEKDLWFEYTSTCTGNVQFDLCGDDSNFDTIAAVFTNGTGTCPNVDEFGQRTLCPPPLGVNNSNLVGGECRDFVCPGVLGEPTFQIFGPPGVCYLVRVGGERDDDNGLNASGASLLSVACTGLPDFCFDPTPTPEPETIDPVAGSSASPAQNVPVVSVKNRFLSFRAADVGVNEAVRVTFVDLPAPFDSWNNTTLWADEPKAVSENAGTIDPADAPADPTFNAARLQCDGEVFLDWSALGVVHLIHEGIVPGGTYEIQLIKQGCPLDDESFFSLPLELAQATWGDLVKDCSTTPCGPPNGITNIIDVLANVDKFVNAPTAIIKARAELVNTNANIGGCVNLKTDIIEVLRTVDALLLLPYPFAPSTLLDACASTCPNPLP